MTYDNPLFIVVDLFCGAGGTTTGFVLAELESKGIAKVIACVNHDPKAIKSHWRNHPEVKHFEEDIRTLDLTELKRIVAFFREKYPNAFLVLWASLECTNFSKAKGGQPRDADSRTLADYLDRYVVAIDPDYIEIENVVEFMSWGPLDENGKPVSKKSGQDWLRWRKVIKSHGYYDDWKELNSANYGAFTSRNRLFGVFAKHGLPIAWPEPTHAKNPAKFSLLGDLKPWNPVKHCLNFSDEGESIFNRKKALSDKTLERIYAGLIKYVAKGDTSFISKYYSGTAKDKCKSINVPAGAITTIDHHALINSLPFIVQRNSGDPASKVVDVNNPSRTITATGGNQDLVQAQFLLKYNSMSQSGKHTPPSIEDPSPVIPAQGRLGLVSPQFLAAYYGNGDNVSSVEQPCPTIPTKDRFGVVNPEFFIDKHFGKAAQNQSINDPAGTIMPCDKHRLVEAVPFIMPTNFSNGPKSIEDPAPTITADRHHTYIVNPSHGGHSTSTDAPCPVIIARQDKAPLYLIMAETGPVSIPIYDCDSEIMIKIKQFMVVHGLIDIKMRMLRVHELLKIQGFPQDYILEGNQTDQKKFIGNSVVPQVVKAWTESMAEKLIDFFKMKVA